ncbi:MAG: arginine deiminase-related protein, partial [Bacteroidota bacterium]
MIRPVRFGYNAQTAVNNAFQVATADQEQVQQQAILEFDAFVEKLRAA